MDIAPIRAFSRGERPAAAVRDPGKGRDVKFFLDNGDGRAYPPRFISDGPVPRG
jgi:hypothetical protein